MPTALEFVAHQNLIILKGGICCAFSAVSTGERNFAQSGGVRNPPEVLN